ncbi:LysR family transcriptional regulator [Shimia sp. R11_0]|uniref:LysR family transcriptional regulator n=1 Tax=Shimia sp. R11_0 TaxID=2821096 RepID=UPI001AD9EA8E|nr:LysR family transcriptional regulator [Shimia sp. R11_0]MBO9477936.1 LysR family transcriptional regulator [Shimia sp. R11_0]
MQRYVQSLMAFVAVGKTGAFVRAAEELGVSPSVISHHVARLEDHLGETLIHRTTRKLTLSENGKRLFESAQAGLLQVERALDQAQSEAEDVAGALRIALPAFVPDPQLETRIMAFATRYEHVALTLDYSDEIVDLVSHGYDLAIRLGDLPSSSLVRQQIGSVTHMLVATPDFLIRHQAATQPQDLAHLPIVAMGSAYDRITLHKAHHSETVQLESSRIKVQSIHGALTATCAGLGFGNLPHALVQEHLTAGRLVPILPEWSLPPLVMQAVWSGTSHRRDLSRRFVDWLKLGQP